jgi:hypothetical protein
LENSVVHLALRSYALLLNWCARDDSVPLGNPFVFVSGRPVIGSVANFPGPPLELGDARPVSVTLLFSLTAQVSLPSAWTVWLEASHCWSEPRIFWTTGFPSAPTWIPVGFAMLAGPTT